MKLSNKIGILSILAIALFIPQQSKTVNLKQWLTIGAGLGFTTFVGYKIYQSVTESNEENNNILITENKDDYTQLSKEQNEQLQKIMEEIQKKFPKNEASDLLIESIKKLLKPEAKQNEKKKFTPNGMPGGAAIYLGSRYGEINKKYGIENEIDALTFTDLCARLCVEKEDVFIPLKLISKNYLIWAEYFSKNKKEHPDKIVNIGSCEIDLGFMSTSSIKSWYDYLQSQEYHYYLSDHKELLKRGVSFNDTIEKREILQLKNKINELKNKINELNTEINRVKKDFNKKTDPEEELILI